MCGIFASLGVLGVENLFDVLFNGLKRLEYRGYDSSGIAMVQENRIVICKKDGKLNALQNELEKLNSTISNSNGTDPTRMAGIAHTRWATHGAPTTVNAHPHASADGNIAIVHNGVIENYTTIKKKLLAAHIPIQSDTDSELFAHLIAGHYKKNSGDLSDAVRQALKEVIGTYGLVAICKDKPNQIVGVRKSSPLIVGVKHNEQNGKKKIFSLVGHCCYYSSHA